VFVPGKAHRDHPGVIDDQNVAGPEKPRQTGNRKILKIFRPDR
jgi:hypothetical protein